VDLNHIFLFIAVISPLLVLTRVGRPGGPYHGWRVASLIVLAVTGVSWIFFRGQAGFIGGGAWFALLFVPAVGLRKVTELAAHHRYKSARKLATVLQILHPSAELRHEVQLFRALESDPRAGFVSSLPIQPGGARKDLHARVWSAPAVVIFILLNIAAFLLELSFGDWNDFATLHRLGALEPYRVVVLGEYWRLFTAFFLHAGVAHLFFNLFALYVLGPGLERTIGSLRFAAAYLISGLGSSAGVVALWIIHLTNPGQVVGASGCVMGIVGAWAGYLLRHRHAPRARERLLNILLIIAIQTAFDLTTPQISTAAHICGLLTGFIVGLVISPSER
jgi:membrane associated rhomboid family serine protease